MQAKARETTRRGGVQVVLVSAVMAAVAVLPGSTRASIAFAPRIRRATRVNRTAPWIVGVAVTGLSLALGNGAPAREAQA